MDTRESPRHDDHRRASARDARRRHAPGVGPATPRVIIDGIQVMVPPGTSVMRAAKLAGVDVAKLCATDSLEAFGSCRLCLAEVEGMQGTPASRTTPCADGMVVSTRPEPVQQRRRGVMELYPSDHPLDCAGCERGSCEMQGSRTRRARRGALRLRRRLARRGGRRHAQPVLRLWPEDWIDCSRRVRISTGDAGTLTHTVEGRGFGSRITAGGTDFMPSAVCLVRCLRAGLPGRRPHREVGHRAWEAVTHRGHDVRQLRGRVLVQGRGVRDSVEDEWQVVSWGGGHHPRRRRVPRPARHLRAGHPPVPLVLTTGRNPRSHQGERDAHPQVLGAADDSGAARPHPLGRPDAAAPARDRGRRPRRRRGRQRRDQPFSG